MAVDAEHSAENTPMSLPLSLEQSCLLNVIFHLDKFPVSCLSLLPFKIRKKILANLTITDILHLLDTAVMEDIEDDFYHHILSKHSRQTRLTTGTGCSCQPDIFALVPTGKEMIKSVLTSVVLSNPHQLPPAVGIDLMMMVEYITGVQDTDTLTVIQYIYNHFPCLHEIQTTSSTVMLVVPPRFHFLKSENSLINLTSVTQVSRLLNYCHMPTAYREVRIHTGPHLMEGWLSRTYQEITNQRQSLNLDVWEPEQIVHSFLQDFLSKVETLHLVTDKFALGDTLGVVGFIFYNIIRNRRTCLKHLAFHGDAAAVGHTIATYTPLLCDLWKSSGHAGTIETLSVLPASHHFISMYECNNDPYSQIAGAVGNLLSSFNNINSATLHGLWLSLDRFAENLQSHIFMMDVQNISFLPCASFKHLLSSILVDFVRKPNFTYLNLGDTPLPHAYTLTNAFICTPARHKQTLIFKAKQIQTDEVGVMQSGDLLNCQTNYKLWPQSIAQAAQFKHLDIRGSDYCFLSWLSSIPNLHDLVCLRK